MSRTSKSASMTSHNSRQSRHSSTCQENRAKTSELSRSVAHHKENIVPLSNVYSNDMITKTLAKENLLHQPLPDNFDDHMHRIVDDTGCKNNRAVGCKCYGVPGPTQCSKLKVYRPKTALEPREITRSSSSDRCPVDSVKADKKEFYSDIDYALCWDLCPPGHPEHKKATHIDGSNGSLAPAVFSLVPSRDPSPCLYAPKRDGLHSPVPQRALSATCCSRTGPDEKRVEKAKQWIETTTPVNPSAVMTIVKKPEPQENYLSHKKPPQPQEKPKRSSCSSHQSMKTKIRRDPSPKPYSSEEFVGSHKGDYRRLEREEVIEKRLKQRNINSSSPNLVVHRQEKISENHFNNNHHNRNECNDHNSDGKYKDQEHYIKNAREPIYEHSNHNGRHKSGTKKCMEPVCPKLLRSRESSISSNSRKNGYSPPKLKNHHVKKNYSIPTLMPPFTMWPGTTGQDYPEHWRLASVYQHSYKPIEMRKRNLLQCIYQ